MIILTLGSVNILFFPSSIMLSITVQAEDAFLANSAQVTMRHSNFKINEWAGLDVVVFITYFIT